MWKELLNVRGCDYGSDDDDDDDVGVQKEEAGGSCSVHWTS